MDGFERRGDNNFSAINDAIDCINMIFRQRSG
jgi:hypothetical protein